VVELTVIIGTPPIDARVSIDPWSCAISIWL